MKYCRYTTLQREQLHTNIVSLHINSKFILQVVLGDMLNFHIILSSACRSPRHNIIVLIELSIYFPTTVSVPESEPTPA